MWVRENLNNRKLAGVENAGMVREGVLRKEVVKMASSTTWWFTAFSGVRIQYRGVAPNKIAA